MKLQFKTQAAYDKWAASLPERSRLRLAVDNTRAARDAESLGETLREAAPVQPAPARRRRGLGPRPLFRFSRPGPYQLAFMLWLCAVAVAGLGFLALLELA